MRPELCTIRLRDHISCFFLLFCLIISSKPSTSMQLSFHMCCAAGINGTHEIELDQLIKESSAEECHAIDQLYKIFRKVVNVNSELTGDRMTKCLQVKRGCFYAAKANIFCSNAARSIDSPLDKLAQITEFSPQLLKSPRDCCKKHNRLPALDVVSGDSMDFDINGVPYCCSVPGYDVPEDLDPFANIKTQEPSDETYFYTTPRYKTSSTTMTLFASMPPSSSSSSTFSSASSFDVTQQTTNGYAAKLTPDKSHTTTFFTTSMRPVRAKSGEYSETRSNNAYESTTDPATAGTTNAYASVSSVSYTTSSSHPMPTPTYPTTTDSPILSTNPSASYRHSTSIVASTQPSTVTTEGEIICEPGFKWSPEKQLCLHTLARCPKNMYLSVNLNKCLPKVGDRFVCPKGYEYRNDLNGCEDVNECEEGVLDGNQVIAACPQTGQQCINTEGSYDCACKSGFQRTYEGECVDIDECKVYPNLCKAGYECRNLIGSYQCIRQVPCGFGYVLNQETQECEDIDECKAQPDICGPNMICINVRGGMKCIPKKCPGKLRRNSNGECTPCPSGYIFNEERNSCEDINECELNSTLCRPFEKCLNRPGDYVCEPKLRCEWGYQLNADGTSCDDVDECKIRAFNCQHGQICVNTPGAYKCENSPCHYTERYDYSLEKCVCPSGFQHLGNECVDIDECAEEEKHGDPQNPLCGAHEVCVNTVGAFRCVTLTDCPKGFHRATPKASCTDVNECMNGEAKCGPNMYCENTLGSYRCLCERGFKNINETTCVDINECEVFRPEESCPDKRAKCVNTAGSYRCICPIGFVWHSYPVYACRDVNECVLGIDTCGSEHKCINDEGGYHCECAKGFRLNWDNKTCIDIDECKEMGAGNLCHGGICVNTPGSFRCECASGFRLGRDGVCIDINECQEFDGICNTRHARGITFSCVNLHGSYRCVSERCPPMYVKSKIPNGYRCSLMPEYECTTFDPYCLNDRPLRTDHLYIELPTLLTKRLVLGELDSTIVKRGTVNVELLEHYAYDTLTKRHISVRNSLKLGVKPSDRRTVELLLIKPIDPPADIFVSVRISELIGQKAKVRSTTRFYLYATENYSVNLTSMANELTNWPDKK